MSDENGTATLERAHQSHGQLAGAPVDPELVAMQTITTALDKLDEATRGRVLAWVNGRWPEGTTPPAPGKRGR